MLSNVPKLVFDLDEKTKSKWRQTYFVRIRTLHIIVGYVKYVKAFKHYCFQPEPETVFTPYHISQIKAFLLQVNKPKVNKESKPCPHTKRITNYPSGKKPGNSLPL